jgi:hypothetical protein
MGKMKGCISFSLYGDGAKYSWGMLENARLAKQFYPGWTVVVHAQRGHYAIPALQREGAEVVEHDHLPGSGGMFWRFLSTSDPRFTHTIIRDADSRLNPRDRAATDEWLASGKALHVIRDNLWHERIPILGGAWGMQNGSFGDIAAAVDAWPHNYQYGDDEDFLGRIVWPVFYNTEDFLRHCHRPNSPDDTPFPPHELYDGFVCEQIAPVFNLPFRAVVLSPERYAKRRAAFFESVEQHGGFLQGKIEWWVGKTAAERVVPSHVDHATEFPHYYLASRDHIDIIESAILDGTENLIVFEDDARFAPDFEEYLLRAWISKPDDWMALMLGGQPWTDDAREYVSPETANSLARVRGCLGMHGVLWNRAGMRRAFDHFTYWNRMTIDQAFRGLQHDKPHFYAPAKWIVDIASDVAQFGRDE